MKKKAAKETRNLDSITPSEDLNDDLDDFVLVGSEGESDIGKKKKSKSPKSPEVSVDKLSKRKPIIKSKPKNVQRGSETGSKVKKAAAPKKNPRRKSDSSDQSESDEDSFEDFVEEDNSEFEEDVVPRKKPAKKKKTGSKGISLDDSDLELIQENKNKKLVPRESDSPSEKDSGKKSTKKKQKKDDDSEIEEKPVQRRKVRIAESDEEYF